VFVDKASITIRGGAGGDGAVSFYRGKYVPNGGPDGGDGGDGGSLIFVADKNIATLMDFKLKRLYAAENGANGQKRDCYGKKGADLRIRVPVGTVIRERESGSVMADLSTDKEEITLIKGGRGGRGNAKFATPVRQAPKFSEKGKPFKEYQVILELKLIADAGLIGLPNVGKSTMLSMVTNANPKIANYHFTTLTPNLGVVRSRYGADFVLADIPGLIEGASEGHGLGHDFLGHVERTKVLCHIVDASGLENDVVESVEIINAELAAFNPVLLEKPRIIAANKMDIPEAEEGFARLKEKYEQQGFLVMPVSAATGDGLQDLCAAIENLIAEAPEDIVFEADFVDETDSAKQDTITIHMPEEGFYVVEGAGINRMLGYTNLENEDGMAFFQKFLRDKGIVAELERQGVVDGDTVSVAGLEFEYFK